MTDIVERSCVYPDCPWKHSEQYPPSLIEMQATEDAIKIHLDDAHAGWTIEEVRKHAGELQRKAVQKAFGLGPMEMFK